LPDRSDDERRFGGLCLRERGEGHDSEGSEDMSSRKGSGHEEDVGGLRCRWVKM
jgi:hypothetical protein